MYSAKCRATLSALSKFSLLSSSSSVLTPGSPEPRIDSGFISFSHVTLLKCFSTNFMVFSLSRLLTGRATPIYSTPFPVFCTSSCKSGIVISTFGILISAIWRLSMSNVIPALPSKRIWDSGSSFAFSAITMVPDTFCHASVSS